MKIDFKTIEEYVANHLRLFIFSTLGLIILAGITAVVVFFIVVRGEEQTMVPDVTGKELTEALLELQVKELYPRVQLRYTQTSKDRGYILEQDPPPGTIVKAGRRIRLTVSQGVILNRVEDFVGQNIDVVRMDLLTLQSSSDGPSLFTIREPLMFEFSSDRPGTILAQKPEPGTDISGPVNLDFVVSKGRDNQSAIVPVLTGLTLQNALDAISSNGINFQFTSRDKTGTERSWTVVSQSVEANTPVALNTPVHLVLTAPDNLADGEVFGIYSYTIPQNPYPLTVRLEAQLPSGERQRIISVNYTGGVFTVPYKLPAGSILILSMLNRELNRVTI